MKLIETPIPDLFIIEPTVFEDTRGFFYESYSEQKLAQQGINYKFVQDNHSKSSYGVLRGLHFQRPPFAQTKLVRVTQGKVIDVAVDLRAESPTYLHHFLVELSAENKKQLLIPQGFAHGFLVTSETCEFLYKCDNFYNKEADGGIRFDDPQLNIDWLLPKEQLIISDKDNNLPYIKDAIFNFPFK